MIQAATNMWGFTEHKWCRTWFKKKSVLFIVIFEMHFFFKPNEYLTEQLVGISACVLVKGCSQVHTEGTENVIQNMECHLCRQMCANLPTLSYIPVHFSERLYSYSCDISVNWYTHCFLLFFHTLSSTYCTYSTDVRILPPHRACNNSGRTSRGLYTRLGQLET